LLVRGRRTSSSLKKYPPLWNSAIISSVMIRVIHTGYCFTNMYQDSHPSHTFICSIAHSTCSRGEPYRICMDVGLWFRGSPLHVDHDARTGASYLDGAHHFHAPLLVSSPRCVYSTLLSDLTHVVTPHRVPGSLSLPLPVPYPSRFSRDFSKRSYLRSLKLLDRLCSPVDESSEMACTELAPLACSGSKSDSPDTTSFFCFRNPSSTSL